MLLIFDKNERLLATLGNDNNRCPIFSAQHIEQLNGLNILEFTVPGDHEDAQHVVEDNFVAFKDMDGYFQLFRIVRVEDINENNPSKYAYCEISALELLDYVIKDKRPQNVSAQFALIQALEGTRWEVGQVSNLGLNSTNFYYETALSAIQKILNTWKGEVRFRVRIEDNMITRRYVDILDRRGADRGRIYRHGKDVVSARRTLDITNVKTALYGRGRGEELETGGFGRRLTFADVEWSVANGDPVDKPLGQEWLGDPDAFERWGFGQSNYYDSGIRYDSGYRYSTKQHRFGIYENPDVEDPEELLRLTWEELQRIKEPLMSYEATVADLELVEGYEHEVVRLGDTVRVIDEKFQPELKLQSRVIELRRNLIQPEKTEIILGNFLPVMTDSEERLKEVEARLHDRSGIWDDKYTAGDPIDTAWLDGVINAENNMIEDSLGYVYMGEPSEGGGILILDKPKDENPTMALQLRGGGFRIANSKNPDGTWNWRTFGTGNGFTADELRAGNILTSVVNILSDLSSNPILKIEGNLITVHDDSGNERVEIGQYDANRYGVRVTSGEIFGTSIRTGSPGSSDYIHIGSSGFEPLVIARNNQDALTIWTTSGDNAGMIQFYRSPGGGASDMRGQLWSTQDFYGDAFRVTGRNSSGSMTPVAIQGSTLSLISSITNFYGSPGSANVLVSGSFQVTGSKNALHLTDSYGFVALGAHEGPQMRFIDVGVAEMVDGMCKVELDPIYVETIEPHSEETPWNIQATAIGYPLIVYVDEIGPDYIVFKEKFGESGQFNWSISGVRKGFSERFKTVDFDVLESDWEDEILKELENGAKVK